LGLQIPEAPVRRELRVVIVSRKSDELEEAAARLKARDAEALWIAADANVETGILRVSRLSGSAKALTWLTSGPLLLGLALA
jgi:short-subunit dehydrogenase